MKKNTTTIIGKDWSFAKCWNETLDAQKDRPLISRDYLYASELGQSYIDRYLKMNAVPYSNPPNFRSQRKFTAGRMWEWVLGMVLIAAGILKKQQIRVEKQLPKLLRVSGRLDFIVGGTFDYDAAKKRIAEIRDGLMLLDLELPPFFFTAADNFVDQNRGQILQEVVYEAKTVSSYMMEKVQKTGAMKHHVLQDFHYVYGNDIGIKMGKIGYLCKDDCTMFEPNVYDDEENFHHYKSDIKEMTKIYNNGFNKNNPFDLAPPKESEVLFEEGVWRFTKNFKVEYSPYLKSIYGYETPKQYSEKYTGLVASWNRVFKRCVLGDKMTDKNLAVIEEAKSGVLPNWDKMVTLAKKNNAFDAAGDDE